MRKVVLFGMGILAVIVASADQQTALDSFTVSPELEARLWAGTDMVHSPVAMDVDAKGRVWVAEDLQRSGVTGAHARIKILADTDNDGRADSVKLFGPTFGSKPMGISVFDNVVVVSMAPKIHVYTDVNRDDVFDPKVDTEEVIADGFHGHGHDHALHQVVPGPSGKWYVNHGNIGADLKMPDGREIHVSSYYSHNPKSIGKQSFDGRTYVGGFGLRMDPNGHNAEVIFQNTRNAHAMAVTSFGDVLHADNDDPTHARAAWAMEYANFGYASLEDGSRSWEDSAKSWEQKIVTQEIKENAYERHGKNVLRRDEGHWRQHFPGVTPPGNVWGPGAPTGDYFIEGDELGRGLRGRYLVCESVHRAVFSFRPDLREAQVELVDLDKSFFAADRKSKNPYAAAFLPSDVAANLDGSLFVSDWNSAVNARGSGNAAGGIFRLRRQGETKVALPVVDFETTAGLLAALKSPSPSVRWVAQDRLKRRPGIAKALLKFVEDNGDNPYYQARAVFILAQLAEVEGPAFVKSLLASKKEHERIVAFRALRLAGREAIVPLVTQLAEDPSLAVRREAVLALRNVPLDQCREVLAGLIAGYEGSNRWYLEALGAVCDGREAEVYEKLVRPLQPKPEEWTKRQRDLAWRLRSPQAREDLANCIVTQNLDEAEFRRLAYAYGLCYSEAERQENLAYLRRFAKHPAFGGEHYQTTIREFIAKDIADPPPVSLSHSYLFPKVYGNPTTLGTVEEIAALQPVLENGRVKASACLMCHQIGDAGVDFGPKLTNWGQVRAVEEIVRALVAPAAELAHGFDKPVVVTQKGHRLEGVARGYSHHAGALRVKTFGGQTVKVAFRRPKAKIEYLKNHSWMPSAADLGFSNQDVRDVAAYLQSDIDGDAAATPEIKPEFSRGEGPGWVTLTGADFTNVNCHDDTWRWEGSHAWCTGKPTGVIRYRDPLTNFEFSCEWMHKQKGGNSGVFVWATPQSIIRLAEGKGRLPQGIEVQVLDLGYREVYEARHKKKGDWFTSHGDVFPVGGHIKMTPFPPVAPNGRRSFPSKETTLGINNWNHYYVRAIDGEVRLWVNGEEVSGGTDISPAWGYLCLESEGAPVEFKNLRLRKLPPLETTLPAGLVVPEGPVAPQPKKAVSMKNHELLGTWAYLNGYSREFRPDGTCVLRNGDQVIWTKKVMHATKDSVTLEGGYQHLLKGDVLHIEGQYQAKRQ